MKRYQVGERIAHRKFGPGTILSVESDEVIVVNFDRSGRKRIAIDYAPLSRNLTKFEDAIKPDSAAYQKWLSETFEIKDDKAVHYHGNHWQPFLDDLSALIKRMPEIIPKALDVVSYASNNKAEKPRPADWPRAICRAWPLRVRGMATVITAINSKPHLVAWYPFDAEGSQQEITLTKVHVWKNGVEGQIECRCGGALFTFFDTLFSANRIWYEIGEVFQVILTGIAYSADKAEDKILQAFNPPLPEHIKQENPELAATWSNEPTIPVHTRGMSVFMPIPEWDRDEYFFRGPIKSVKEMEILDQMAWKVRATVLRELENGEMDLDIIVTKKVWGDKSAPQVGEDIEGSLWLQGYLAYPGHAPRNFLPKVGKDKTD